MHLIGNSAQTEYGKELYKEAVLYLQSYIAKEEQENVSEQDKKLIEDCKYRIELLIPYIKEE